MIAEGSCKMARHAKTYFNIAGADPSSCGDLVVIEKFSYTEERMTKQQLIEAVSTKTGHGKADVEAVVDSVLGTIGGEAAGQ
jgi:Bacterial DNA-binding protein